MQIKKNRCQWCTTDQIYQDYHDTEWGVAVYDDQALFECLMLECMQAGLSWLTILKRREGYRRAFANFDIEQVVLLTEQDIDILVQNVEIIRHRKKIEAIIHNAKLFKQIQLEHGKFSDYLWSFSNNRIIYQQADENGNVPIISEIAQALAKDLKKRGFKFVGATTIHAYLQAVGVLVGHDEECFLWNN